MTLPKGWYRMPKVDLDDLKSWITQEIAKTECTMRDTLECGWELVTEDQTEHLLASGRRERGSR